MLHQDSQSVPHSSESKDYSPSSEDLDSQLISDESEEEQFSDSGSGSTDSEESDNNPPVPPPYVANWCLRENLGAGFSGEPFHPTGYSHIYNIYDVQYTQALYTARSTSTQTKKSLSSFNTSPPPAPRTDTSGCSTPRFREAWACPLCGPRGCSAIGTTSRLTSWARASTRCSGRAVSP